MTDDIYTKKSDIAHKRLNRARPTVRSNQEINVGKYSGRTRLFILVAGSCVSWAAIIAIAKTLFR